ncbi:MAG TPA: KTSC domain-containing protein [Rhizomicrobium sp.]|jgi:hypothetical protein|nr:KTSC domain-containing protein [Rhizomicrobium sp.]
MSTLDGSPFEALVYSEGSHELLARFHEIGTTFVYEGVPREEYEALLNADSAGSYFNEHIRDQFRYHRQ